MATETDVQLMANRLAKLRADEARAQRKVEEMRRKADQVVATKHRNFRKYQMKYQHVAAEYEVLQQRAEKQRSEREVHAKNVSEAMLKVGEGKRLAAAAARKELKEGRAFAERGKTEHIMRARQNRDRIRNSHGDTSKWKSKQAATLTTAIEEDAQQRLAGEEVRIEKNISKLTSAQQEEERLIANLCKIQQEELGAAAELGAALSYDPVRAAGGAGAGSGGGGAAGGAAAVGGAAAGATAAAPAAAADPSPQFTPEQPTAQPN